MSLTQVMYSITSEQEQQGSMSPLPSSKPEIGSKQKSVVTGPSGAAIRHLALSVLSQDLSVPETR